MLHILQSLKYWSLYLYSPLDSEKTARLPRKSDTQRQRERKRMLRTVGLYATTCWDVILQAWLREDTDAGGQVEVQTETEGGRELPRGPDNSFVADLILTIHIVV